jgi:hypothetical protein
LQFAVTAQAAASPQERPIAHTHFSLCGGRRRRRHHAHAAINRTDPRTHVMFELLSKSCLAKARKRNDQDRFQ